METQAYSHDQGFVAHTRGTFLVNTYAHVVGAILAFVALEYYFFSSGIAAVIAAPLAGNWLLVLGGLVLVSYLVSAFSAKKYSKPVQYGVLAAYILVQAAIFVPILAYGVAAVGPALLTQAAYITIGMVIALSVVVYLFRVNFSFLGPFLAILGIAALVLIVLSLIMGFQLGMLFSLAMITYAAGAILYETSRIGQAGYDNDDYVAAAVGLLTSVMLLLWYVVQALIGSSGE